MSFLWSYYTLNLLQGGDFVFSLNITLTTSTFPKNEIVPSLGGEEGVGIPPQNSIFTASTFASLKPVWLPALSNRATVTIEL